MPREDRQIVFNYDEVYKALRMRAIIDDVAIPPSGTVRDIILTHPTHDIITLKVVAETSELEVLEFSREFFALSLVFFCQGNNIPIPRAGTKSIMANDGEIVMHIKLP